jgi:hypothetical protein
MGRQSLRATLDSRLAQTVVRFRTNTHEVCGSGRGLRTTESARAYHSFQYLREISQESDRNFTCNRANRLLRCFRFPARSFFKLLPICRPTGSYAQIDRSHWQSFAFLLAIILTVHISALAQIPSGTLVRPASMQGSSSPELEDEAARNDSVYSAKCWVYKGRHPRGQNGNRG